jgi:hypothetical protein
MWDIKPGLNLSALVRMVERVNRVDHQIQRNA